MQFVGKFDGYSKEKNIFEPFNKEMGLGTSEDISRQAQSYIQDCVSGLSSVDKPGTIITASCEISNHPTCM